LRADARRNREQVLRAAQRLFAKEGAGVSIDDIARCAGVGAGTVYRHYPSKEMLCLAVAVDQIESLTREAELMCATEDPEGLFTLLRRIIAASADDVAVKNALVVAGLDLRSAARSAVIGLTQHFVDLLTRAQVAGIARSDVTAEDVIALAVGAVAAVHYTHAVAGHDRAIHVGAVVLDGIRVRPRESP
jgi:AcrR family transcriptional regulator